jgi:putative ATP-dependent endonuclease of OLD family
VKKLGSGPFKDLRPGLDPAFAAGNSALVLHDGDIPLTQFGLGSRRLLSLSIQENALAGNSIVAIDEVESGLDPHRLAHLIRYLRDRAQKGELQVFLTTHSPLVVESLTFDQLFVVRAAAGVTTITGVPSDLIDEPLDVLQGLMRAQPSSLLARRVVIGEGATEVGFVKALLRRWDALRTALEDVTSVTAGAAVSNGAGSDPAPKRAKALADLGYPSLLVIDGDVLSNAPLIAKAQKAGAKVLQWSTGNALEDVIIQSLPVAGLQQLVELAADDRSDDAIWNAVGAQMGLQLSTLDVAAWIEASTESIVRVAIAKASKNTKNAWFKREDRGAQLGELVWEQAEWMKGTEVYLGAQAIFHFVYESDAKTTP